MTSPKFLYRSRTSTDADGDEWLDPYVLASRLSYFLWSSMPDERLFEGRGGRKPGRPTKDSATRSSGWLKDDKAEALKDGFAEQWLSTRHLASASPSPAVYPDFDESASARR